MEKHTTVQEIKYLLTRLTNRFYLDDGPLELKTKIVARVPSLLAENAELKKALSDLLDYHPKPHGTHPSIAPDGCECSECNVVARAKGMVNG